MSVTKRTLLLASLAAIFAVFAYSLSGERRPQQGMDIKIDENGIRVQKK
jgi:hypothetical protein